MEDRRAPQTSAWDVGWKRIQIWRWRGEEEGRGFVEVEAEVEGRVGDVGGGGGGHQRTVAGQRRERG